MQAGGIGVERSTKAKETPVSQKRSWRRFAAAAALASALTVASCSSEGGRTPESENQGGGSVAGTERIKTALITHAAPGDTFWDIVRKGAEEASEKDNVELQYLSDPEGGRQAQLIEQAVQQGVDGIAVTLAKPDAVASALEQAQAAGIPVVSLNAGEDRSAELGAFTHFGSTSGWPGKPWVSASRRTVTPIRSASSRNRATSGWKTAAPVSRPRFRQRRSCTCRARI